MSRSSAAPSGAPVSIPAFVLRFALAFAVLESIVVFLLWQGSWFEPYARWNVALTAALMEPLIEGTRSMGVVLMSPAFSLTVQPGCDAYQASAVFLAGVVAFPCPLARKWLGASLGVAGLLVLNLLRLGVLLWTGVHHRSHFELVHLEILPAVFVLSALGLLLTWALWARA